MKSKVISILLAAILCLSMAIPVFATNTPDIIVTFDLTSGESEHEVTVETGDIVLVTYSVKVSEDINSFTTQDQITYDPNFFDLVDKSISVNPELGTAFVNGDHVDTDGTHYVFFNSTTDVEFFESDDYYPVGYFKLKVKATSGSSWVRNTKCFATDNKTIKYGAAANDLKVIIGGSAPHTHAGVKQDGVPAGEYTPGYKDYYECDCGDLFEDEACTTPIANLDAWKSEGGRGYLAPTHKHAGVKQDGTPAGEYTPGFKDYYKCSCGDLFEEEACTTPIDNFEAWKSEGGRGYIAPTHKHVGVLQSGVPATEDVAGYKDYYECSCGAFFEDATCTVAIDNLEAWKSEGGRGYIAPLGHTHVGVLQSGVPAQEFEAGYKDYYACKCGNLYEDAACTIAIPNFDAWKSEGGRGYLAPTHVHGRGVKQDGKPATEEAAGYKDYYKCSCDGYFEEAVCTTPISDLSAWKSEGGRGYLPKLPHTHKNGEKRDGVPAEEFKAGYKDYYECSCGGYFEDAACTVAIPDLAAWKSEGGRGYLPMLHEHELEKHDGVPATKEAAGYKDYYECKNEECAKYFEDATAKVEITDLAAWKSEGGRGYIAKLPKEEEKKDQPDTGDNGNLALWFVLMSLAGAVVCGTSFYRKKKAN